MEQHGDVALAPTQSEPISPAAFAALRELFAEEPAGEFELFLSSYLTSADRSLRELRAALDAARHDAVQFSAHALKGASGNIGAYRMAELCQRMMDAGHPDETERNAVLAHMELELARLARALGYSTSKNS